MSKKQPKPIVVNGLQIKKYTVLAGEEKGYYYYIVNAMDSLDSNDCIATFKYQSEAKDFCKNYK